jgi:hypothetical protein
VNQAKILFSVCLPSPTTSRGAAGLPPNVFPLPANAVELELNTACFWTVLSSPLLVSRSSQSTKKDENGLGATNDLLAPFNWSTLVLPLKKMNVGL